MIICWRNWWMRNEDTIHFIDMERILNQYYDQCFWQLKCKDKFLQLPKELVWWREKRFCSFWDSTVAWMGHYLSCFLVFVFCFFVFVVVVTFVWWNRRSRICKISAITMAQCKKCLRTRFYLLRTQVKVMWAWQPTFNLNQKS